MVRVAINGFGRIGRLVFKAGFGVKGIEFVGVNDLTDTKTLAYLLQYDSVHGRLRYPVKEDGKHLIVKGKKLPVFAERDPENLPRKKLKVDVVVESTGFFRHLDDCEKHLRAGAKKVLLSAPGKSRKGEKAFPTFVIGVNEKKYKGEKIVSLASCTTNSLAPLVKVLDKALGIKDGFLTTVHAFTGDQRLVDAPDHDLRRGRCAPHNIVPTTTGAAKAVGLLFPHLRGKLDGIAMRVPVPDGSITDFVCAVKKKTSVEEVNKLFKRAASKELKGVLEYQDAPLVSMDIVDNAHSSIFDSGMTHVTNDGKLVKVCAWYDNEWGYSNRMIDFVKLMGKK